MLGLDECKSIVDTLSVSVEFFGEDQSDNETKMTMCVQCLMSCPVCCVFRRPIDFEFMSQT